MLEYPVAWAVLPFNEIHAFGLRRFMNELLGDIARRGSPVWSSIRIVRHPRGLSITVTGRTALASGDVRLRAKSAYF